MKLKSPGFERERGRENGSFPVAEARNRWVSKSEPRERRSNPGGRTDED